MHDVVVTVCLPGYLPVCTSTDLHVEAGHLSLHVPFGLRLLLQLLQQVVPLVLHLAQAPRHTQLLMSLISQQLLETPGDERTKAEGGRRSRGGTEREMRINSALATTFTAEKRQKDLCYLQQ